MEALRRRNRSVPFAAAAAMAVLAGADAGDRLDRFVDRIQAVYQQAQTLEGRFVQKTRMAILERVQESSGRLQFKKPGRMRWEYESPVPKQYVSDGSTLWIHVPEDRQVLVSSGARHSQSRLAMDFLWGLGRIREEFRVQAAADADRGILEKPGEVLALIPRRRDAEIERMVISVDPSTLMLEELVLFNVNGNRVHYRFPDLKAGSDIPDARFRFDPPPGTRRVELPN